MKKILAFIFCTASVTFSSQALALDGMPEIDGHWKSFACELRPQQGPNGLSDWYLKRDIKFSNGMIDAVFTSYADRDCKAALSELHFVGKAVVNGASDVAEGAKSVDLIIDESVKLTAFMQPFADFLNSAGKGACGEDLFVVGQPQEVRKTGCKPIGLPKDAVTREYETLLAKDNLLYFGARPIDGALISDTAKRPSALQVPLVRQ